MAPTTLLFAWWHGGVSEHVEGSANSWSPMFDAATS